MIALRNLPPQQHEEAAALLHLLRHTPGHPWHFEPGTPPFRPAFNLAAAGLVKLIPVRIFDSFAYSVQVRA